MPHGKKPRGTRGKRKTHDTHRPNRPLEEETTRLQQAITKRTKRYPESDVPSQTTSASASRTDATPLTQEGVVRVSVNSDSDQSPSEEGSGTEEGFDTTPPPHSVESETRDGRIIIKVQIPPITDNNGGSPF